MVTMALWIILMCIKYVVLVPFASMLAISSIPGNSEYGGTGVLGIFISASRKNDSLKREYSLKISGPPFSASL
jgi:hypothetical protein